MVLADSALGESGRYRSSCDCDHFVAFRVAIAGSRARRQSLRWNRGLSHTPAGFLCRIGIDPHRNLPQQAEDTPRASGSEL